MNAASHEDTSLESKIANIQTQFYDEQGGKSWFQKSQQKTKCAVAITQTIPLNDLFIKTFYIIPNTNQVYIDYPAFKTFAHTDIYAGITQYILQLFRQCIDENGSYEVHINLKSFTMTAAQRYRDMISQFCNECFVNDTTFNSRLVCLNIYHSPKMFDAISSLFSGFIDEQTKSKIRIIQ
jgi:hypothetical protein